MKTDGDDFYIGYRPEAPPALARFTRPRVAAIGAAALVVAAAAAAALPYLGDGVFEFGRHREISGTMRCDPVPLLETARADIPLVASGKHGAPLELCGSDGEAVIVLGTRIARGGREFFEVANHAPMNRGADLSATRPQPLGRFTLTGEIVDAKCYFGVMNPGEGPAHRACAQQCLRGGIPAVFVARDAHGATLHLLVRGRGERGALDGSLLPFVGAPVRALGAVTRQGRWLVFEPAANDIAFLR